MQRILPLFLVLSTFAAHAIGCNSSSNDGSKPGVQRGETPKEPGSADGPQPGATIEEQNTNPIEGVEGVQPIFEAGQSTDGPVWHTGMGVLFFSTPLGDGAIYRMLPDGHGLRVREGNRDAGTTPIGNTVSAAGELFTAELKRLVKTPAEGGAPVVIASRWGSVAPPPGPADAGEPVENGTFDTLNDVVARKDGTMYVTDPGYFANPVANRIHRIDPSGKVEVVEDFEDVPRPNGIALSPDDKTLYVGFSTPQEGTMPFIRKYIVNDDGTLGEWTKFIDVKPADSSPDGLAVDKVGNVYVATKAGVEVYKPNGQPWGTLAVPEKPTGMTFGGEDLKTLYITTEGTKIYQAKLKRAGISQ